MQLFTDTCAWVPLPPGMFTLHPPHPGNFPRSQGLQAPGRAPQQHRGAVTTSPGAAGERAGGRAALAAAGSRATQVLGNLTQHLSAAPDLDTPGQSPPSHRYPRGHRALARPALATLPRHCWPSHDC